MKERCLSGKYSLFHFAYALWLIAETVFNTTLGDVVPFDLDYISSRMDYVVFLLLLIQIVFCQEYAPRDLLSIALITLLAAVSTLLSGSVRIMGTWMFLVAFQYMDLDEMVSITYRILRIALPTVVFLCWIGLLPDASNYRFEVLRHSMGFNHPNYFGMKIFQLSACYVYLHWQSLKKRDLLWGILVIAFLDWVPHSVTSILCTALLLVLAAAGRLLETKKPCLLEPFKTVLLLSAFLCIAATVFITLYVMDWPVCQALDAWMSYRLSYANRIYKIYGISFLGQQISSRYLLDSGYMDLILRSGLLVYLTFLAVYLANMMYHRKNTALFILLCTFAFYGIMEYGVYLIARNIFLLSMADLLYSRCSKTN